MRLGLVRLIERVRFAEFALVMFQLFLLFQCQNCKLPLVFGILWIICSGHGDWCVTRWEIVVVAEVW